APEPLKKLKEENPDPKVLLSQGLVELGMDPNPENMTITYLSSGTDTWFRKYSELLQQMLQQNLGVNIKAEFVEWPVYQKRVDELDYEMGGQGWGADYNDPNTFLDLWTTTAKIVPTGWSNKKYDTLIEKASLSSNEEERTKYFKQAENMLLYEDSVIAPVLYKVKNTYYRNYVKNYKPTTVAPYTYKGVFIEGRE
ncbi:ABC transporter substrate-binding protein, partial [uncultured Cetobacterium sp.]|uniref:ABC transporter substrate-binding protein n=1 Tax=uncultured Cetobacterium sp. TaxID=527638 RepID=UPI00261D98E6